MIDPDGQPSLLASYPTVEAGALHGAAFLYDNSAVAIALVGCGEPKRAGIIGEAILWALDHDRYWHDGRLRNGYSAGPATSTPVELVKIWDKTSNTWHDDGYQAGSDIGNMGWAVLALVTLDRALSDHRYRDAALRVGAWAAARLDSKGMGGFTGGSFGPDGHPVEVTWKSTEQNADLVAAFRLLAEETRDNAWIDHATAAERFVEAMWDQSCACFAVGTAEDGVTKSAMIALDAQLSPLLALPGLTRSHYAAAVATVEGRLRVHGGFTYNEAGGQIWTEGTAEAALLQRLLGHTREYNELMATIEAQRRSDGSYYATLPAPLPTGFGDPADPMIQRFYYPIPHLAPAAWAALAERSFNPFTAAEQLPPKPTPSTN